jgi:hypothetical protein
MAVGNSTITLEEKTMKLTTALVSLLIATSGPVLADQVVVHSTRTSPAMKMVNNAFAACANAFAARMFPGQQIKFRSEPNIDIKTAEAVSSYDSMIITMQAQLKRDNSQLAKASCEVRRNGRIISLAVGMAPAAKLAGLTTNDIKLAMVSR